YQRRRGAVGGRAEDDVAGRDDLVLADEHEVGEEPGEVGPAGVDALPGVLPRAERDDLRVRVPREALEQPGPAVAAGAQDSDTDRRRGHVRRPRPRAAAPARP